MAISLWIILQLKYNNQFSNKILFKHRIQFTREQSLYLLEQTFCWEYSAAQFDIVTIKVPLLRHNLHGSKIWWECYILVAFEIVACLYN